MAKIPVNLRVGDIKHALECAALKLKSERVSDQAFRTVAADQILSFNIVGCAVGSFHLHRYTRIVLRKSFEFGLPENFFSVALEIFVKQFLVFALLQHEHIWIRA